MALCARRAGVFVVEPLETIRVVPEADMLVVGDVPIDFAEIDIVVQRVGVRNQVWRETGQHLLTNGVVSRWKHPRRDHVRSCIPLPVVIKEEENLVLQYWSTNIAPKLIEVIGALRPALGIVVPR